jgi:DNA-binding transcriptional MerR regulator
MSNTVRIGKAAQEIGCSLQTIRRYEERGIIKPLRNFYRTRYLTEDDIEKLKERIIPR